NSAAVIRNVHSYLRTSMPKIQLRLRLAVGVLLVCVGNYVFGQDVDRVQYDLVIEAGRVMDPASGLDDVRNVGISDGVIRAVSQQPLDGKQRIDAKGLIVAPGFIDLHSHGQTDENYRYK